MQASNRVVANFNGSQVYTASFNTVPLSTSEATQYVNVEAITSAVGGTSPSLTLTGQWSFDGGTSWSSSDSGGDAFTAITANGQKVRQMTVKGPMFRLSGTITGTTPTFTTKFNVQLI